MTFSSECSWAVAKVCIQQWSVHGTPKLRKSNVISRWAFSALWYMASCKALICPLFSLTTCNLLSLPLLLADLEESLELLDPEAWKRKNQCTFEKIRLAFIWLFQEIFCLIDLFTCERAGLRSEVKWEAPSAKISSSDNTSALLLPFTGCESSLWRTARWPCAAATAIALQGETNRKPHQLKIWTINVI